MTVFFVSYAKMALQLSVFCIGFPMNSATCAYFQNRAEIITYTGLVAQKGTFMYVLCCLHCILAAALLSLLVLEDSYHTEICNIMDVSENGEVHTIHKIVQFPYILGRALVWASLSNESVLHSKQQVPLPPTEWYLLHRE
jgi:hypothetical protein